MATGNRGGRPRKPTALHVLNGNPSKIAELDRREASEMQATHPYDAAHPPKAPKWLSKEELAHWKTNAEILTNIRGLLTPGDLEILGRYCQLAVMRDRYAEACHEKDLTYRSESGMWREIPEAMAYRQVSKQMIEIEREFGMTPAARGRMQLPERETDGDEMEKLLMQR